MCGLMLAFAAAAGLWQRQRGGQVARVDFSMIEAMLWTMAEPLLTAQLDGPPQPMGNRSDCCAPHGAYRCAGEDAWVALAVQDDEAWQALCRMVPALHDLASLARGRAANRATRSMPRWRLAGVAGRDGGGCPPA